jgi:hypothetical protein
MTTHIMISNVPSLPLHVPHLWLNPNRLMQNGSLITFSETFSPSSFLLGIPGILGSSSETHKHILAHLEHSEVILTDCLVTYIICQSQHPYSMRFS